MRRCTHRGDPTALPSLYDYMARYDVAMEEKRVADAEYARAEGRKIRADRDVRDLAATLSRQFLGRASLAELAKGLEKRR